MSLLKFIGNRLAGYLAQPASGDVRFATCKPELLAATLRKGDVLLVEGSSRFSVAVKYLTQSTWSHAALYVAEEGQEAGAELIEADVLEGVRRASLSDYWSLHTRICRPIGLEIEEIDALVSYASSRLGQAYDLKNIVDLARYLVQTPPVPSRWKRRMLALGSGEPTRAICSSLIAQAFQSVNYPILPDSELIKSRDPDCFDCYDELLHIRHHSLFAPRDFDISPYFQIIKPGLQAGFDPHQLSWSNAPDEQLQL